MKTPSPSTMQALQRLHRLSVYTADLCAAVMVGGASNAHNALARLPAALDQLQERTRQAALALRKERVRS